MPATLIIFFFLIVFALIVVFRSVRVIQQGLVGVVKRLGQFHSVRNPGITFLMPFIDNIEVVDMRETPRTGDRQDVITKDNVSVAVNASIFSQVVDLRLTRFQATNILRAEGRRQAQILEAEGRGQAINTVYAAIHAGNPGPELVAILQLDTLSKFAESPNSKLVVPVETSGLLGAAQAIRSVLDGVPAASSK